MARFLASPIYGAIRARLSTIPEGGTNSGTAASALTALGILAKNLKNAANGYAALNSTGKINTAQIPNGIKASPTIDGPTSSVQGLQTIHVITNFDISTDYVLSAITGSVTRLKDTIVYTAPSTLGTSGFILNGVTFNIGIVNARVKKPSVIAPVYGTATIKDTVVITSTFFAIDSGTDTHASSSWQLATDANFTNIVASVTNSTTAKTTWTVAGLNPGTIYYVRVQHTGTSLGASEWSEYSMFSTKTSFYVQGNEEAKLVAADGAGGDWFGRSVAISSDGNIAIIGAYGDDSVRGSAYIYTRAGSSWSQQTKLVPADGAITDYFGYSVAISSDGNTAIIGATGDDSYRGSVYIYTRAGSSWSQQTKLVAADGASSDQFGYSVAISSDGNTAIIGAQGDDDRGTSSGSAYVYTRAGSVWSQQAKLVPGDGASSDQFGYSVAISSDGNTAIIGAYGDDSVRGSAYIYTRAGSSWSQQTKLVPADGAGGDNFGVSVAISSDGNTAIIGAYLDDDRGTDSGSVYVYTRAGSSWSQQTKLVPADGASSDWFGRSVAISSDGNTAIIGAYGDDDKGNNSGSAYIYTRAGSSWSQQTKLVAADGASNDYFGTSVAISSDGNTAIIGAYNDDDRGTDSGSAYIFV